MLKKYIAIFMFLAFTSVPVMANEAVFSVSPDSQEMNIEPVSSVDTSQYAKGAVNITNPNDTTLSDVNFKSAIDNLDNAQVQVREQLATYTALVEQAKTELELKKTAYTQVKKEYNSVKKKMKTIEKMKKMLEDSITAE